MKHKLNVQKANKDINTHLKPAKDFATAKKQEELLKKAQF